MFEMKQKEIPVTTLRFHSRIEYNGNKSKYLVWMRFYAAAFRSKCEHEKQDETPKIEKIKMKKNSKNGKWIEIKRHNNNNRK